MNATRVADVLAYDASTLGSPTALHEALTRDMPFVGTVRLESGGGLQIFDCRHVHERRYLLRELLGLPYPQADIDSLLLQMLVRPGDVCLDAGANIGVTAVEMLRCGARKVHAFEPVPELASRLRAIGDARIVVTEAALGAAASVAELRLSVAHNQGHTLKEKMVTRFPAVFGVDVQRLPVRVVALDSVVADAGEDGFGEVWKVDVEGAELELLEGARRTLKRAPPRAILCESYEPPGPLLRQLGRGWRAYRALLKRVPYGLLLCPPEAEVVSDQYFGISPTFLFLRASAMDPLLAAAVASRSSPRLRREVGGYHHGSARVRVSAPT